MKLVFVLISLSFGLASCATLRGQYRFENTVDKKLTPDCFAQDIFSSPDQHQGSYLFTWENQGQDWSIQKREHDSYFVVNLERKTSTKVDVLSVRSASSPSSGFNTPGIKSDLLEWKETLRRKGEAFYASLQKACGVSFSETSLKTVEEPVIK